MNSINLLLNERLYNVNMMACVQADLSFSFLSRFFFELHWFPWVIHRNQSRSTFYSAIFFFESQKINSFSMLQKELIFAWKLFNSVNMANIIYKLNLIPSIRIYQNKGSFVWFSCWVFFCNKPKIIFPMRNWSNIEIFVCSWNLLDSLNLGWDWN